MILAFWAAAVLGDSSGYLIGRTVGPRVFQKEKSFFFRKDYLLMAQEFYEQHGGKTIILAKFVPFIRTFAPVVAGAGHMPYRRFVAFSFFGAGAWITSMILLGYFTPDICSTRSWSRSSDRTSSREARRQGHPRRHRRVGDADRVEVRGRAYRAKRKRAGAPTALIPTSVTTVPNNSRSTTHAVRQPSPPTSARNSTT